MLKNTSRCETLLLLLRWHNTLTVPLGLQPLTLASYKNAAQQLRPFTCCLPRQHQNLKVLQFQHLDTHPFIRLSFLTLPGLQAPSDAREQNSLIPSPTQSTQDPFLVHLLDHLLFHLGLVKTRHRIFKICIYHQAVSFSRAS